MSPRFYASLWVIYFAVALVFWLAGMMSMLTVVVFGFIAFGLVFTGMMCVLPTQVAHEHEKEESVTIDGPKPVKPIARPEKQRATVGALRSV